MIGAQQFLRRRRLGPHDCVRRSRGERSRRRGEGMAAAGERGGGRVVRRTATFVFPAELSLDTAPRRCRPGVCGVPATKKFTSSRVVVGMPARWLMAIEKELPPTNEQQMRADLLQAGADGRLRKRRRRLRLRQPASTLAGNMNRVLLVGVLRHASMVSRR